MRHSVQPLRRRRLHAPALHLPEDCEPGFACLRPLDYGPACLLFPGPVGGAASPDYFWHEATLTVAMFGTSWDLLPTGWRRCTDPGAPPACDCYEQFMRPMCP